MTRRLAIVGTGKMGRALAQLARDRGWAVVAEIGRQHNERGQGITRRSLAGAEVAVDFTVPDEAVANVRAAVLAGCPIVVGTTGWYDALPDLATWVRANGGALLTAPNFSVGVNLFERVAELAARLLRGVPGFDAHLVETHHAAKKDAPSGTALKLAAAASRAIGHDIPISSIRTGAVPGTHEFLFDAAFEQIRLVHMARDRRVFADGALVAAEWLIGRHGVFTMHDVLSPPIHDGDP
jgi:4-hydroxy-tetrahydrodipicolinate reductase